MDVNLDQLVEKSTELFIKKGYHHTSVKDIATSVGLSKGSLYHHVNSKQELGELTLKTLTQHFKEHIFCIAYDDSISAKARAEIMMNHIDQIFKNGNLIITFYNISEFVEIVKDHIQDWTNAICNLLKHNLKPKESKEMAIEIISDIQGATLLMGSLTERKDLIKRINKKLVALC